MALWLVRAGRQGERENFALEHGLAVIGWAEVPDLSSIADRSQLLALLEETYPDVKRGTLYNWVGQLWAFISTIQVGDLVALPLKTRSAIVLGEVTGVYRYRPDFPEDARHTRPVRWLKELPRSAFDQDLLYSFGAFMTVCRIQRNNAEERVRALLSGKSVPVVTDKGTETDEPPPDLDQYARDQIRAYIARKTKGHTLAHWVAALLEAQGYKVHVSPEGPDDGVDILAGRGSMGFDPPRIVVQVKSGDSPVDVKVLHELQGVMKNFGAEHGLIVAWGGYRQSVQKKVAAHFFEVRLWDADHFVQELLNHYEKLPEWLRAELPLKRIWVLVPEEQ